MCSNVLRRKGVHVIGRPLCFEVEGHRKDWRLKRTCKKQVEEESMKAGLSRKDAICCSMWIVGINWIAIGLRSMWSPPLVGDTARFKPLFSLSFTKLSHQVTR